MAAPQTSQTPKPVDVSPDPLLRRFLAPYHGEFPPRVDPDVARRLDWPVLCEAIAEHCATEAAAKIARDLPMLDEQAQVIRRMQEVSELAELIRDGDRPAIPRLQPVDDALERARHNAVLQIEALRALQKLVEASNDVRHFFRTRQEDAPLGWQIAERMALMDDLEHMLDGIVGEDGQLADHASPDLRSLRKKYRRLHERMRDAIDKRAHDPDIVPHLQDTYYTLREGRYVLPVKVGARGRVSGIVHATSSSGLTVFVEPADLVDLNNQLRMAEFDVKDEEIRILRRISERIHNRTDDIQRSLERLVYIDLLRASADLTVLLDASAPGVGSSDIHLEDARHPVLLIRAAAAIREEEADDQPHDRIVANDIILNEDTPTMVVSGANAGGKTVTLKTVGLFALMVQSGLPIPASPDSRLPWVTSVFTDIGDEQSIIQDTSTFSAHLANVNGFLPHVDEQTLILLDEPFSGTDPAYASSLAIALMEELKGRGARTIITTHLDRIKAWALEEDWTANASVRFDVEEMRPTYELQLGIPGGSSALAIARRLGFHEGIVSRAEELRSGDQTGDLETIIVKLQEQRDSLARQEEETRVAEEDARKLEKRYESQLERVRNGEIDALDQSARAARDEVEAAREWMREAMKYLRKTRRKNRAKIERGRNLASGVEASAKKAEREVKKARRPEKKPGLSPEELRLGMEVWSQTYRKQGEIVEIDENGNATLQVGTFKLNAPADDLVPVKREGDDGGRDRPTRRKKGGGYVPAPRHEDDGGLPQIPQTDQNTCDLRGMHSDEAIERLDLFLDSALRRNLPNVYIIHGHGTGVLKRAVRAHARQSPYVVQSRPGERGEGGDGVTVIWVG